MESKEGQGRWSMDKIRQMASQGRRPTAVKEGVSRPWVRVDRWAMPDEDAYAGPPEV